MVTFGKLAAVRVKVVGCWCGFFHVWVLLGRANLSGSQCDIRSSHSCLLPLVGFNLRRRLQGVLGLPLKMGASCALSDSVTSVTEYSLSVAIGKFRSVSISAL